MFPASKHSVLFHSFTFLNEASSCFRVVYHLTEFQLFSSNLFMYNFNHILKLNFLKGHLWLESSAHGSGLIMNSVLAEQKLWWDWHEGALWGPGPWNCPDGIYPFPTFRPKWPKNLNWEIALRFNYIERFTFLTGVLHRIGHNCHYWVVVLSKKLPAFTLQSIVCRTISDQSLLNGSLILEPFRDTTPGDGDQLQSFTLVSAINISLFGFPAGQPLYRYHALYEVVVNAT